MLFNAYADIVFIVLEYHSRLSWLKVDNVEDIWFFVELNVFTPYDTAVVLQRKTYKKALRNEK